MKPLRTSRVKKGLPDKKLLTKWGLGLWLLCSKFSGAHTFVTGLAKKTKAGPFLKDLPNLARQKK